MKVTLVTLSAALLTAVLAVPAQAAPTSANVYQFADGSQVSGAWSTLQTGAEGAHMTLHTSNLTAAHTVTVFWVIFNQPTNCRHGEGPFRCGPGDLPPYGGDDSAQTSLVYASGHQVGGSGSGDFAAFLPANADAGALWGPGLTDPAGADIHLLVHDHGALTPQQRAQGIHTFGPCNPCADLQFSVHEQ